MLAEAILRVIQSADPAVTVGTQLAVGGGGLIGRTAAADICVPGSTISRRHARLERSDAGWVLTALTKSNAVFVDGAPINGPVVVAAEQTIQLGGVLVMLVADQGTAPVLEPMGAPPLLEVRDDGGTPAIFAGGQLLELAPQPARVLACLIAAAGVPVHRWDLLEVAGRQANLDKCVSQIRSTLRAAMTRGALPAAAVAAAVEADAGDPGALARALVSTRRGHGYVLQLSPRRVRVVVS